MIYINVVGQRGVYAAAPGTSSLCDDRPKKNFKKKKFRLEGKSFYHGINKKYGCRHNHNLYK